MRKNFYPALLFTAVAMMGMVKAHAQCNQVTSITRTDRRCDSVNITWPLVTGAASYSYWISQSAAAPSFALGNTTGSLELGNLIPSTLYYIQVRTNCGGTSQSAWKIDTFTTTACAPGLCLPPVSTTFSNTTNVSADATWNAFPGAIGYEYILDQTYANPTGTGTTVTTPNASFSNLYPGSAYYLHLRSKCSATSTSSWGLPSSLFTTGACTPVTTVTPTIRRCDSVSISWNAVPGAPSYIYAINQSATPPGAGQSITTNSVEKGSLTPSTQYYIHVRTNCIGSVSTWNSVAFTTPSCTTTPTCNAPATVTYNSITANGATVSWAAAANAIGYEYVLNQTVADPTTNGTLVTGTNATLTGLTPVTTYYWHLRTKCSATSFSPWKPGAQLVTPARTGVSNTANNELMLLVYPSPANQKITINLNHMPGKNAAMSIFSIDGRKVKTIVPALQTEVDIKELQSGIYIIRYSDTEQNQVTRFTKE